MYSCLPAASPPAWEDDEHERRAYADQLRSSAQQLQRRQRAGPGGPGGRGGSDSSVAGPIAGASSPPPPAASLPAPAEAAVAAGPYRLRRRTSPSTEPSPSRPSAPGPEPGGGRSPQPPLVPEETLLPAAGDAQSLSQTSGTCTAHSPRRQTTAWWPAVPAHSPQLSLLHSEGRHSQRCPDEESFHASHMPPRPFRKASPSVSPSPRAVVAEDHLGPTSASLERFGVREGRLPVMDRDGRGLGDKNYRVPSPPQRDCSSRATARHGSLSESRSPCDYDTKPWSSTGRVTEPAAACGCGGESETGCDPDPGPSDLCEGDPGAAVTPHTPLLDLLRQELSAGRAAVQAPEQKGHEDVASSRHGVTSPGTSTSTRTAGTSSLGGVGSRAVGGARRQLAHSLPVRQSQPMVSEALRQLSEPLSRLPAQCGPAVGGSPVAAARTSERPRPDGTECRRGADGSGSAAEEVGRGRPSVTDRIRALESQSRVSLRTTPSKSVPNLLSERNFCSVPSSGFVPGASDSCAAALSNSQHWWGPRHAGRKQSCTAAEAKESLRNVRNGVGQLTPRVPWKPAAPSVELATEGEVGSVTPETTCWSQSVTAARQPEGTDPRAAAQHARCASSPILRHASFSSSRAPPQPVFTCSDVPLKPSRTASVASRQSARRESPVSREPADDGGPGDVPRPGAVSGPAAEHGTDVTARPERPTAGGHESDCATSRPWQAPIAPLTRGGATDRARLMNLAPRGWRQVLSVQKPPAVGQRPSARAQASAATGHHCGATGRAPSTAGGRCWLTGQTGPATESTSSAADCRADRVVSVEPDAPQPGLQLSVAEADDGASSVPRHSETITECPSALAAVSADPGSASSGRREPQPPQRPPKKPNLRPVRSCPAPQVAAPSLRLLAPGAPQAALPAAEATPPLSRSPGGGTSSLSGRPAEAEDGSPPDGNDPSPPPPPPPSVPDGSDADSDSPTLPPPPPPPSVPDESDADSDSLTLLLPPPPPEPSSSDGDEQLPLPSPPTKQVAIGGDESLRQARLSPATLGTVSPPLTEGNEGMAWSAPETECHETRQDGGLPLSLASPTGVGKQLSGDEAAVNRTIPDRPRRPGDAQSSGLSHEVGAPQRTQPDCAPRAVLPTPEFSRQPWASTKDLQLLSAVRISPITRTGTYHKDSYMAHRRDWKLGHEGRYRRTLSPSPPSERRKPAATAHPAGFGRSVSCAAPSRDATSQPTLPRLRQPASTGRLHQTAEQDVGQAVAAVTADAAGMESLPHCELTATTWSGDSGPSAHLSEPCSAGQQGGPTGGHQSPPSSDVKWQSPPTEARSDHILTCSAPRATNTSSPSPAGLPTEADSEGAAIPETGTAAAAEAGTEVIPEPATVGSEAAAAARPADWGRGRQAPPPSAAAGPSVGSSGQRQTASDVTRPLPSPTPDGAADVVTRQLGQLTLNGIHREGPLAVDLVGSVRTVARPTARDLLDPRRLPEVVGAAAQPWEGQLLTLSGNNDIDQPATPLELRWPASLPTRGGSRDYVHNGVLGESTTATENAASLSSVRPGAVYLTTSASRARFLTQYSHDFSSDQSLKDVHNVEEVRQKQSELASRISSKLAILREEQRAVEEEVETNAALGAAVTARVEQLARPSEADRYRTCVEQVGTITSLLLGLAGRLARAETALASLPDRCVEEREHLVMKRDKLSDQLAEARLLEEGVQRRRRLVDNCLGRYLSTDELADYRHFVQMKAKLIVDARDIDDKIRLGEEQLAALTHAVCPP